jgi:succinate dehydrogenase / fumarate reductase, cytochrome b subunit
MSSSPQRPLSPHLQVYRLPLTGLISITHRITGVLLSVCLFGLLAILLAMVCGERGYCLLQYYLNHWLIQPLFWGVIFSLYFHLCHGVRHLLWDAGRGFAKTDLQRLALFELAASAVLTAATWTVF